jgi:fucose 4-O-acetylase-like acetyltransferase
MRDDARRYDLDWIRVGAFGLLVCFHVGMYYVSWDWHVKSPAAGPALEPFMLLTAPWRLSLLFVVSGAASAFLFRNRPDGYLWERTRRLLLPLLFGMLVLVVPQAYYEVVEKLPGGYHDGYLAFYARYLAADPTFCREGDCLIVPTWNHLWFLPYLWVYVALVWLATRFATAAWQEAGMTWLQSGPLARSGALWLPIAWLVAARFLLIDRFESTHALIDDWHNHAQYLPLFALGFAVARSEPFWDATRRLRWRALALALVTYAFVAWYFGFADFGATDTPPALVQGLQRVAWATNQWATIVAILGFGQVLRGANSRVLRYLVPAVLPVYMLHQTLIVVLAHNLQPLHLRPALEGPLLVAATFALCFAVYEVIRRLDWVRPLFGLKPRPRLTTTARDPSAPGTTRPPGLTSTAASRPFQRGS